MIVMEVFRSPHNTCSGSTASPGALEASSRLNFGVIPDGDAFSEPQHSEQPVPRVIRTFFTQFVKFSTTLTGIPSRSRLGMTHGRAVWDHAMGNLGAALATVMVHAMGNLGARFVQGICSGLALQCGCDTKSDCKSCH